VDDVDDGWGTDRDNLVLTDPICGIAHPLVLSELTTKLQRFR
jgi:hypothetical protein